MHAIADDVVPLMETKAGQKAKASVIGRAVRLGVAHGAYRCTCCGGRCDVRVEYDDAGAPTRTSGKCRTPNCIAWEG
ncbi:MAG TPA: hypothetical protein VFH59_09460 [Frateuria sp.]|uniref:hypothetical protein n=1 Tax=Frateuria sp. TaxID=2211372 RepID=UPI002D800595|nr:hypothetical protein [Frateuria sp.]HET6805652.1 hypothetical protein [Frateuria sp.]